MSFLAKHCHSPADRETYATLVLHLLPTLESLEIAEIERMLRFLAQTRLEVTGDDDKVRENMV